MKKGIPLFFFVFMYFGTNFIFAQGKTEILTENRSKETSRWGLYIFKDWEVEDYHIYGDEKDYTSYLNGMKGFCFGLFHNVRLTKGLYYQPEISYSIYNGDEEKRISCLSLTPVHLQAGYHLGWVRPFLAGGADLHFLTSSRDENSDDNMDDWRSKFTWGYFYGIGIDMLNLVQLNFRIRSWVPDFECIKTGYKEYCFGVSFFL